MMHYPIQLRTPIFVKGYRFLSFPKKMSKNIGKKISKNFNCKYSQKRLDQAKQSATHVFKNTSKNLFKNQQKQLMILLVITLLKWSLTRTTVELQKSQEFYLRIIKKNYK